MLLTPVAFAVAARARSIRHTLLLPSLLAIALTLAGLLIVFRAELAAPFALPSVTPQRLERRTAVGLAGSGALVVIYLFASALSWPLGVVATFGALLLVTLDGMVAGWRAPALLGEVTWTLFPLLAGLLLLVNGAEWVGLVTPFVQMVEASAHLGSTGLPLAALGMAVLANVLNNLPAALMLPVRCCSFVRAMSARDPRGTCGAADGFDVGVLSRDSANAASLVAPYAALGVSECWAGAVPSPGRAVSGVSASTRVLAAAVEPCSTFTAAKAAAKSMVKMLAAYVTVIFGPPIT